MMLFLFVFVALAQAAPFNSQFWTKQGPASPSAMHSVLLATQYVPNALATCDSELRRVSFTNSPDYGKHLSFTAVGEMFRNKRAEKSLLIFLRRSGIKASEIKMSPHGEYFRVTTTIAKLQRLLGCRYSAFVSDDAEAAVIFRDLDWSIPAHLNKFIDFVSDTMTLSVPPSIARQAIHVAGPVAPDASGQVTPALLHSFFNIDDTLVADSAATQSLFESLGQSFAPSDLAQFQTTYGLPNTPIAKVIGTNTPSQCATNINSCFEASLDVEFILAIAQNATTTFWSIPGQGDIFVQWIEAMAADPSPPLVTSISYASLQPEDPKIDIERFNTDLCKLSLKGITVFAASGDDGVYNFQARNNPSICTGAFVPSFPSTSPYVLTVGATQGPESGSAEIMCSSSTGGLITSGGGLSTFTKRPDWQDAAVSGYLNNAANDIPPHAKFNALGAAYPDVSSLGHNYPITVAANVYVGSGTSASTPVTAGMFTLINGLRLQAGKAPVGWLNPTIYQLGGNSSNIFHKISSGKNNCAAAQNNPTCCPDGFSADSNGGWSPTVGFGSMDYTLLKEAFMNF